MAANLALNVSFDLWFSPPTRLATFLRASVDHGYRFDLDQRTWDGETSHLHQGTGRRVGGEELLADLTVAFPVADVRDEHGDLHDVPEAGAAGFEDAAHILKDAAGLSADVVRSDEVTVLVERKLTSDVDCIADAPAMRVTGPRIGHVDGLNRRACHACLLLVTDCKIKPARPDGALTDASGRSHSRCADGPPSAPISSSENPSSASTSRVCSPRRGEEAASHGGDEGPPIDHWITSSARGKSDGGIVKRSNLARREDSMSGVEPRAFEFALLKIDDGFVFEKFVQGYLGSILGHLFMPVGGIHDKGIDGLEHIFHRDSLTRYVYQASIEKDPPSKLRKTLAVLSKNNIEYDALYFTTNQVFANKDKVIDELFEKWKKPIHIYDLKWLSSHVNDNQNTLNHFQVFVESYLHDFSQPGHTFVVADLVEDPRLFVFLRQQWETYRKDLDLAAILTDTLILYALEGTDPAKGILKTRDEIYGSIGRYIKFDPSKLTTMLDQRLKTLSTKPRRIQYHSTEKAYCLPYETRLEIEDRNLRDAALHDDFKTLGTERLQRYLQGANISAPDALSLLEQTFHRLFYQQGLEFADFILRGENNDAFEKRLPDIISAVVDETKVPIKTREAVKTSLLVALRDLICNGSPSEKEFLAKLSHTYMMLFLLQFDPKLSTFFSTMAFRLTIYVCTSIIIPALSEYYLDVPNRRHWNLLKEARNAGVNLVVNETILKELVSHFRMIVNKYKDEYRDLEEVFLSDEVQTLYIDEIMIRAYFYSKMRKQVDTFENFIDNFVSPDLMTLVEYCNSHTTRSAQHGEES